MCEVANKEIFDQIDIKIVEIMNLIEHQKNFPLLLKDVSDYIEDDDIFETRSRLCFIYTEISKLRNL